MHLEPKSPPPPPKKKKKKRKKKKKKKTGVDKNKLTIRYSANILTSDVDMYLLITLNIIPFCKHVVAKVTLVPCCVNR